VKVENKPWHTSKDDEPEGGLPLGLGQLAYRALRAARYTRLEQFTRVSEADLLKLHGVGPKAIRVIRSALQARGLSFTAPDKG
jgi:hypothetical protein